MPEDKMFDVGSPAATAAHDQNQAGALELLRDADQFVLMTLDAEGNYAVSISASFVFACHAENDLNRETYKLLMAELRAQGEAGDKPF